MLVRKGKWDTIVLAIQSCGKLAVQVQVLTQKFGANRSLRGSDPVKAKGKEGSGAY